LKQLTLVITTFLFSQFCIAQLINTKPVEIPLGPVNFNAAIVKQNKIKNIQLVMVDKPDGEMIIDKGGTQGYEFDRNGNLTRYYYTILNRTENLEEDVSQLVRRGKVVRQAGTRTVKKYYNDTIFVDVFYNNTKWVIAKRARTGDYYDAYYYEYNAEGRIQKEVHCRETNVSENIKEFKLGVQSILSSETFQYTTLTATQLKKSCLNDEGREYKKAIINYDEHKKKLSENYEFIVSWMQADYYYKYDSTSNLIGKTFSSNESGEMKTESTYEYNAYGDVITEKRFKKGVLMDEINILYDDTTRLPKSEVNRDHINASIGIVKFGYTYYD